MKESNAIPKSKSHWISTFLIVAPRLMTAAADEADGDGPMVDAAATSR